MFWCISYHLGAFGLLSCLMELKAKRSELVQKFVPRSRVGVFRDERTRTTPMEPELMFWCISYHLGPLGFLNKLGAKHSELVQKFMPRSCVGILRNVRTRSTPLDPILLFCCVLYHLGAFGTLSCLTKLRAKCSDLGQKFMPRSRVGFFSRRMHPIHPIGP